MLRATALVAMVLSGNPAKTTVSEVPCKTVAQCWLDADGHPIARPKAKKGRPLPEGDCGAKLVWLQNRLRCESADDAGPSVCVAEHVGDKC